LRRLGGGYLSIHNLVDNDTEVRHQRGASRRDGSDPNRRWQAGDEELTAAPDAVGREASAITSGSAVLWISSDIHSRSPSERPREEPQERITRL
jgi:hypothetical protein